MRTRKSIGTVAAGAVALSAMAFTGTGTAEAETVKDLFFEHGIPATITLSDEDREEVIQRDQNDTLDVDDSIFGIIAIDQLFVDTEDDGTNSSNLGFGGNNELTAAFQVRVVEKNDLGGGNFEFVFGPDEDFVNDDRGLFDHDVADGTVAVFYEDDNPDLTDDLDRGTQADQIARAVNGDLFFEIGFTGQGGEFFVATGPDEIVDVSAGISAVNSNFALNRTSSMGAGGEFEILLNDFGTEFDGSSNIRGTEGISTDFDFTSNANFQFTVVPTPAAAASGLFLLGLMGATRRGRRQRA